MIFLVSIFAQIFMLFYAGADIKIRWLNWLYVLAAIAFSVGLLFHILHWPLAEAFLTLGPIVCLIIFGYNFINKPRRNVQDYLLLAMLFFLTIHSMRPEIPDLYRYYIHNIYSTLLWINFVCAVYLNLKGGAEEP
jgi:hypothetical protein